MLKAFLLVISLFLVTDVNSSGPKTLVVKNMTDLNSYLFNGNSHIKQGSIYKAIKRRFEHNYEKIGLQEIAKLKSNKNTSLQAGINHIGMVYSSSFTDFSIYLKREFAPDLFDDEKYIVIDNFDIYVDAQKLLKNLKNKRLIDITNHQYDAYGGISFKRSYRYIYFADSFGDALNLNLDKLFFVFEMLRNNNFLEMEPYEIISKEDSLTVGVGARASSTPGNLVHLELGGIAEFQRLSRLEIQALGPEDRSFEDERFRISFQKERGKSKMGYVSLSADFLNILRWTLFQYEFGYHYLDSYRINLGFNGEDINKIKDEDSLLGDAIKNILLTGRGTESNILKPHLISQEHNKNMRHTSRYSLLLRGKSKECETSEIKIIKDNTVKQFFRHTFERVKYRTSFMSKLFSSILNTFLSLESFILKKQDDFHSRNVCIEYESSKDIMKSKGDLLIDNKSDKLSLKFEETYYVHNPKGKVRDRCAEVLRNCPGVEPDIIDDIEKGKYKADMKININYTVNKDAIDYFNSRSLADIYDAIELLCTKVKKRDRIGRIIKYGDTSEECENDLQEHYDLYYKKLISNKYSLETYKKCDQYARKHTKSDHGWAVLVEVCMHRNSLKEINPSECSLPLWHLSNFIDKISKYTKKKEDMYAFFGFENVFFYGYLQGRTLQGNHKTCFKKGNFSGTGLIDNYMRQEKMRPESLLILE